jgi:hypothetical protein
LKNKEEDISDEKYSLYLKTSIFQSLLNIFLLYNQAKENFLREELELIALNIFEYLGIPDAEFDQYINNFSHTNIDVYFSAMAAVRLKNRLLNIYDKHIDGIKYFRDPKRGICFIIEKTRTHSKYKSVTGIFI